jgi:hypothetical protein
VADSVAQVGARAGASGFAESSRGTSLVMFRGVAFRATAIERPLVETAILGEQRFRVWLSLFRRAQLQLTRTSECNEDRLNFCSSCNAPAKGAEHAHDSPVIADNYVRAESDLYFGTVAIKDAGPVVITLPQAGDRFMSTQVISEDEYVPADGLELVKTNA